MFELVSGVFCLTDGCCRAVRMRVFISIHHFIQGQMESENESLEKTTFSINTESFQEICVPTQLLKTPSYIRQACEWRCNTDLEQACEVCVT